jgi:hypothetical protein
MNGSEPDIEEVYDDFMSKRYGDGLPIIPPTRERVDRMLEFTDRKPDDSLGKVPPSEDEATVEAVAANAVMAGCKPEYFPVVVIGRWLSSMARSHVRSGCTLAGACSGLDPFTART